VSNTARSSHRVRNQSPIPNRLSEIHTVLHMSVPQPDLLTQTLSENVPSATTLGLIAAPTHFVTGRGVTLFFDGEIYGEGAVGLALLKDKRAGGVPKQRTEFHGLHKLSSPLTVTRSALQLG